MTPQNCCFVSNLGKFITFFFHDSWKIAVTIVTTIVTHRFSTQKHPSVTEKLATSCYSKRNLHEHPHSIPNCPHVKNPHRTASKRRDPMASINSTSSNLGKLNLPSFLSLRFFLDANIQCWDPLGGQWAIFPLKKKLSGRQQPSPPPPPKKKKKKKKNGHGPTDFYPATPHGCQSSDCICQVLRWHTSRQTRCTETLAPFKGIFAKNTNMSYDILKSMAPSKRECQHMYKYACICAYMCMYILCTVYIYIYSWIKNYYGCYAHI